MTEIRKVFISGGAGMVGKNLVEVAPEIYILLTPSRNKLNLLHYDRTLAFLQKHKPDLIIHCAGIVGGIQANIKQPVKFLLENTGIGKNIVWAAHKAGIQRLLNLGSSCMYPRNATMPLKEKQILKGELEPTNEGYAINNIMTVLIKQLFHAIYTVNMTNLHLINRI